MTVADLLATRMPILIAAADKDHAAQAAELVKCGASIVVHDPAEKHLADIPPERTIVIRRSMKTRLPKATFIPHPYRRCNPVRERNLGVIAHSRVDFDKYTHLILEANDLGAGVRIFGAPNPMYVHFKIHPRWPDFAAEPFPRDEDAGAVLCAAADAVVDMSAIKNDGGGSQYSFMEAWDARTPLVISGKWTAGYPDDEMQNGVNCLVARDGKEIKACLDNLKADPRLGAELCRGGDASLDTHAPAVVGLSYRNLLGV